MLVLKSSRFTSSQYLLRAVSRFYVSQLEPNENNSEPTLRYPRVISIPDSDISTESTSFNRISLDNPEVAQQLVKSLSKHQKRNLLSALYECKSLTPNVETDLESIEPLFRRADRSSPIGLLDRYEFIQALRVFKLRQEHDKHVKSRQPVGYERLITLSVATGIPYIAFGFLDNLIMILAGESIEHMFGLALGLSIMAAAAIGNTVSDVAGVCFAESVEGSMKKVFGLRVPKLSKFQRSTTPVRVAKTSGAIIGVCIGCVLGMFPLLWFDEPAKK